MAKPAKVKIRVSTQPVVVMEAEVLRKIRQHARTSMKAEVCGVLIGNTEQERMTVEACIAGINAAQGGAHVTFTQDTWEHIYKIKDKEFPDHKIVGWYHSHPGFGVFLSEHDLFIQQNFFSNPLQVAWVFDPHTDEEGCFGWIGSNIEKLTDIRVGYSQAVEITSTETSDYDEEDDAAFDSTAFASKSSAGGKPKPQSPSWIKWAGRALEYLAAMVLGVMLCFVFLNWRWAPVFEQAERYGQLVEALKQFDEQHPGVLNPIHGPGTNGPSQPPLQQQQPQPSPTEKGTQKGNNGKH
ncbi:MAG TPA: Mov34/MPN/PAD-1 family protein [Candidatus Angelobacter sp.]|jgi:proteasome lid subunit RPN8/RPN11